MSSSWNRYPPLKGHAIRDELENELKNMGFVRAHLSFLVNMKYITKISSYVMTLTTGKKIPVPKARYAQVKREYMLYKGEE